VLDPGPGRLAWQAGVMLARLDHEANGRAASVSGPGLASRAPRPPVRAGGRPAGSVAMPDGGQAPQRAARNQRTRRLRRRAAVALAALVAIAALTGWAVIATGGPDRFARTVKHTLLQPTKAPAPAASRDGRWRQDLDYLQTNLVRMHANAFHTTPRPHFEQAFAAARERVPTSTDAELTAAVMRLIALVGDGHTATWSWSDRFRSVPLRIARMDGSWLVVGAPSERPEWLGAELLAIGETPVDAAMDRLTPLVSWDSEADRLSRLAHLATTPELLHAVGLQAEPLAGRYSLRTAGGIVVDLELDAAERTGLIVAGADLLYRRHPGRDHWMLDLPEGDAVYVRYRRCADREAFTAVAHDALALLDARPGARLVVDIRSNSGGASTVIAPLFEGIRQRDAGRRTFVLMDSGTYSSATKNAHDLRSLGATLVGAPTGDAIGGWGEVRSFALPNSGIRVQVSTYFFPGDALPIVPDLHVEPSVAAWLEGSDPIMLAALAR
jgi:hypothetical protein